MGRKKGRSRGVGYWRGIVDEWRRSRKPQSVFCRESQLSYSAFYYWYRKLAEFPPEDRSVGKPAGRNNLKLPLAEVVLIESERGSSPEGMGTGQDNDEGGVRYEISLRGDRRIRLRADFKENALIRLVHALESC